VYWEARDAVVLIDPLVPTEPGDADCFWQALDADVERVGLPVEILLTSPRHMRSSGEIASRYHGTLPGGGDTLPAGVVELAAAGRGTEVVIWLPGPCALVVGDVLVGNEAAAVGLEPKLWLGDALAADRRSLAPLLELPVERILVSHGEPVLAGAREALTSAIS
jgi:hypothetical protein